MRKLIIDTDPGTDDAVAIIAAGKHPDFDIIGITTVAGNKGIEFTTNNALKLVKLLDLNCKVYKGAAVSLQQQDMSPFNEDSSHGVDGLGGVKLPYDEKDLGDMHAVDFILEQVKKYPNEVELLVIGPVTNIALAIQKDPETMKLVKAIYSMGGGVMMGNMNPVAEFNYWFDGIGTKVMFDFGVHIPIYMVGLNVTRPSYFTPEDFWFMKLEGGKLGQIIYDMQTSVMKSSGMAEDGIVGNIIHDLLTFMYMVDSNILKVLHTNVSVATEEFFGQTVVDTRKVRYHGPDNAYVAMDVDIALFKETFIETVFGSEKRSMYHEYVTKGFSHENV